jgi:hypothetical protein
MKLGESLCKCSTKIEKEKTSYKFMKIHSIMNTYITVYMYITIQKTPNYNTLENDEITLLKMD